MSMVPLPDYTGTKDVHTNLNFRIQEGLTVYVGPVSDRDQPYTWGRARKALSTSISTLQFSKLLALRGRIQDRRIKITTPDPDGF